MAGEATWRAGLQYSVTLSTHTLRDLDIPLPSVSSAQGKYALLPRWVSSKAVCPSIHHGGKPEKAEAKWSGVCHAAPSAGGCPGPQSSVDRS